MAPTPARFRSILCPVDFSEQSADALRCAVAIRGSGGRITVLTVVDPLLLAAAGAVYHKRRGDLRRTRVELDEFVSESLGADRGDVALVVAQGDAADAILKTARRLKSDLIVMGTHGMTGVERLFVGSTTERVLRRVTIPVLAVPRARSTAGGRRLADQPVARLIAPMVPPPASRAPKRRAGGSMARIRAIAAGLRDKAAAALMERDRLQIAAMDAVMRGGRPRPAGDPKRSPRRGAARRRT
jgi:nucleotide-binding universal stress UspA family protein